MKIKTATRIRVILLAAACLAAVSACGGKQDAQEGAEAEGETPIASSSAGLPKGDLAAGKVLLATRGASGQSCVDCHGVDGKAPIDASYPKLGGQYHDYLAQALQAYRSGDRGGSPTSDLMASQAKGLSDQQIADVSAYLGSVDSRLRDLQGLD